MISLQNLALISVILLALYFFVNFYAAMKLSAKCYREKMYIFIYIIVSFVDAFLVYICIYYRLNIPLIYLFIFLLLFFEFYAFFREKLSVTLWGALNSIAVLVGLRGFITSSIALFFNSNLYTVMTLERDRFTSLNISLIVLNSLIFYFAKSKKLQKSVRIIFANPKQLFFVDVMVSIMTLYMLFCTDMFYYAVEYTWFTLMHLICNVTTVTGFHLVYRYAFTASVWKRNTLEVKTTQKLLERQIFHYHAYAQYAESIRRFRHDYAKVTASISSLLRAGEGESALQVLEQMDHTLQSDIAIHHQFSADISVDAALHELADESLALGAQFDASVIIPPWPELTPGRLTRLFTALSQVLSRYCATTPDFLPRRVRVKGEASNSWFTLVCTTSFGGTVFFTDNDSPPTDPFTLDFNDAKEIVDNLGGFISTEIDTVDFILKINVNISKAQDKGGSENVI